MNFFNIRKFKKGNNIEDDNSEIMNISEEKSTHTDNSDTYTFINKIDIEVDGVLIPIGYLVKNNQGKFEEKTWLELEELTVSNKVKKGKIDYFDSPCVLKIKNGEIIKGNLSKTYFEQLKVLGIVLSFAG